MKMGGIIIDRRTEKLRAIGKKVNSNENLSKKAEKPIDLKG